MGWTRTPRRRTAERYHRRPDMDALEVRTLLSASHGQALTAVSAVPPPGGLVATSAAPAGAITNAFGTDFNAIVGASAARDQFHVDGTGMTVAVIDSGANYKHEALGSGFGPGHKVVGGYDFADKNGDPFAKTLDHGTAVAGLIASSDPQHPGVAPGADVVALRVFDDQNQGDFNRVADALQWVVDHHDAMHISAVNLSLSDGRNYAQNWFAHDGGVGERITTLVGKLDALNIPVVTAAGNSFDGHTQGVGFTGIIADTIDVTSTDAADHLVANAQRLGATEGGASATDLAAPGEGLYAPGSGDTFQSVTGTSFSTPLVTGAVLLLQQVYESRFGHLPSVSDVDTWLKDGSDPVFDPATGITIGRLDIPKALGLIPNPAAQVLTPPAVVPPVVSTPPPVAATPTPPAAVTPVVSSPPPVTAPAVVVAPPAVVTPPAAATPPVQATVAPPATPPASTTTTTTPPATSPWTVWLSGAAVSDTDAADASSTLSSLPAWFYNAVKSMKGWLSTGTGSGAAQLASSPRPAGSETPTVKIRWAAGAHAGQARPAAPTARHGNPFVAAHRRR